jgi:hypothetical protein
MKIAMEITDCEQCPFHKSDRVYTGDSWDMVFKITCTKENKTVRSYKEWNDPNFIPSWCPQKIEE